MHDIQQRNPAIEARLKAGVRIPGSTPEQNTPPVKRLRRRLGRMSKKNLKIIAGVVLAVVVIFFTYNYIQTRSELKRAADPQAAIRIEAEKLAKEVGKYLELPKEETPTVATVKNKTQLNGQVFFERAENGDKVLIYPEAKRAVLYRPSTKKVIEYAPVETSQNQ